jgi:hypothetical protein
MGRSEDAQVSYHLLPTHGNVGRQTGAPYTRLGRRNQISTLAACTAIPIEAASTSAATDSLSMFDETLHGLGVDGLLGMSFTLRGADGERNGRNT